MHVSREDTFRASFSRGTSGAVIGLCAVVAVGIVPEGAGAVLDVWPWLALVAVVTWMCYWRPKVVVTDGEIEVVNPFRTYRVPWPAVEDVETKWALTLITTFGAVRAWAAPAPGRQVIRRNQPADRRIAGVRRGEIVRPADLTHTESGAAAHIVRQRWLRLRDAGYLDGPPMEFERAPVQWHRELIALLLLTATAAVLSVAW